MPAEIIAPGLRPRHPSSTIITRNTPQAGILRLRRSRLRFASKISFAMSGPNPIGSSDPYTLKISQMSFKLLLMLGVSKPKTHMRQKDGSGNLAVRCCSKIWSAVFNQYACSARSSLVLTACRSSMTPGAFHRLFPKSDFRPSSWSHR